MGAQHPRAFLISPTPVKGQYREERLLLGREVFGKPLHT